ncbi:hypothetical protein MLD38_012585 [Melastoma candidum]|uniref:Uncharacterized protein n=1 Tax=Melastoma candidum TaxID=119954 RepID=A0ACB9R8L3_9MYRT|nr:hypothetical protein MLD38_012585 [Melastoma candidum]
MNHGLTFFLRIVCGLVGVVCDNKPSELCVPKEWENVTEVRPLRFGIAQGKRGDSHGAETDAAKSMYWIFRSP